MLSNYGPADGLALSLGLMLSLGLTLGEPLVDGEILADGDTLGETDGLSDDDGEILADGDTLELTLDLTASRVALMYAMHSTVLAPTTNLSAKQYLEPDDNEWIVGQVTTSPLTVGNPVVYVAVTFTQLSASSTQYKVNAGALGFLPHRVTVIVYGMRSLTP